MKSYSIVNRVSLPTISMKEPGEYFLRLVAPIELKPSIEKGEGEGTKNTPIVRAIDLKSGELGEVVLGQILHETLVENYPDAGYVGKAFRIEKRESGKQSSKGREYRLYYVDEIDWLGEESAQ